MRILITGGAGFIGEHAARHLRAAGHGVEVLSATQPAAATSVTAQPSRKRFRAVTPSSTLQHR